MHRGERWEPDAVASERRGMGCSAAPVTLVEIDAPGLRTEEEWMMWWVKVLRQYLAIRAARSPSFSLDERRLYFLWDVSGVPQVWSVGVEGNGWPQQLTFHRERVAALRHSPRRPEMLFTMDQGGNERHQIYLLGEGGHPERRLTFAEGAICVPGDFSPDGEWVAFACNARHAAFFDVYVMRVSETATSLPDPVLRADGTHYPVAWAPDGNKLLVSRVRGSMNNDLLLLDLGSGTIELLTPHQGLASYQMPAWNHRDGCVYLLSDQGREFRALCRLRPGEGLEVLHGPEADVDGMALRPDGSLLAATVNEDGWSRLILVSVEGEVTQVGSIPDGVITELQWSPSGRYLAFVHESPVCNPEVWLLDSADGSSRRLTDSSRSGLARGDFLMPELVTYPTFDGRRIPAWYYHPKTSDSCPCVVMVHGGPESQKRPTFDPLLQFFLRQGYAVFAPNVRGSTGYGRTYTHLDDRRRRMDAVADLAWGARWLRTRPEIDPRRIAVYGASYGGFMVLAALCYYPDLWAAGVDLVGIANFVTFLENTGPWRRRLRESEYGSLAEDRQFLQSISPIHHVDKIRAPLLLIHGMNDPRVPVTETQQMVKRLQELGRCVEVLYFPDEGHGIVKTHNRFTAYQKVATFLEQHLKGDERDE